jgi:hypothetical protein
MNENVKNLAAFAGFILWGTEEWNPGDVVDWASRYDNELIKFATLIVDTTLRLKESGSDPYEYFGIPKEDQPEMEDIELDMDHELMMISMMAAHKKNITFNKFMEDALIKLINQTTSEENIDND